MRTKTEKDILLDRLRKETLALRIMVLREEARAGEITHEESIDLACKHIEEFLLKLQK